MKGKFFHIVFIMVLLISNTSSLALAARDVFVKKGDTMPNLDPRNSLVIPYDKSSGLDPKNNPEDRELLKKKHEDEYRKKIIEEIPLSRPKCTYVYGKPHCTDKDWKIRDGVDLATFTTAFVEIGDDDSASAPSDSSPSIETRSVCENKVSYRPNSISKAEYQLLRQNSVFVDREAQFRLVAEVKYDIWVDQECWREERVNYGSWYRTGGTSSYSGVASTQVYDPQGVGYDEFHPKSMDHPRTRVRRINNTTFGATWTETGPKGTTDYIQGTVILNNKNKFKELSQVSFSSSWGGRRSADVWRTTHNKPDQLVYDIDESVDVKYKLSNGRTTTTVEVEGVASSNK